MNTILALEKLENEVRLLEHDLGTLIAARLEDFYEETGLSPASINIDMIERRCIGERRGRHFMNGVSVSLGL